MSGSHAGEGDAGVAITWHTAVSVRRSDGGVIGPALGQPAAMALKAAAESDPALSALTATAVITPGIFGVPPSPDILITEMTVLADGPVPAMAKAWALVSGVLGESGGWDLAGASVTARRA